MFRYWSVCLFCVLQCCQKLILIVSYSVVESSHLQSLTVLLRVDTYSILQCCQNLIFTVLSKCHTYSVLQCRRNCEKSRFLPSSS